MMSEEICKCTVGIKCILLLFLYGLIEAYQSNFGYLFLYLNVRYTTKSVMLYRGPGEYKDRHVALLVACSLFEWHSAPKTENID